MSRKLLFLVAFFLLAFTLKLPAQTQMPEISILEIFQKLEQAYPYKFSYADNIVKDIKAPMPPNNFSFEEALNFLEQNTLLKFSILKNNIVAVQKLESSTLQQVQELQEVVLQNYLAKGISKKTNGSFEIDYQNFGILPGLIEPDVLLSLQALPGVESPTETTSQISIRGGTHDQNLILWDDIRVYQSGHFFGLISAFNPYQTKKAVLIKNGTNAAYGNSVASVISMQTNPEVNEDFYAELGSNFLSAHGFVDVPTGKKSSLQVSARTSINSIIETPTYRQYSNRAFQDTELTENDEGILSNNEEFWFYDTNLRYLVELTSKDKLRFNFFNSSNELSFTENLTTATPDSRESSLKQNSLGGGIFHFRKWNDKFSSTAQFYLSSYELNSRNSDILADQRLLQENKVLETGFKLNAFLNLNKNLNLQSGYELLETGISNLEDVTNPVFRRYIKEVILSHSLYASALYKSPDRRTFLETGARLNYFNKWDFLLLEPRLSFNQRFRDFFTLEILGEYKSQTTTQIIDFQTDFLGIEKQRWQLANQEDIPVLKSRQISVGINYNRNKWLISTETYIKKVDGISSKSQGFQNQYEQETFTGGYVAKGVDFLVNKKFKNISTWLSYSLTKNTYTFPGLDEQSFPNNVEIRNSASFAASYELRNFKISAGMNWRNGKPFTPLTPYALEEDVFQFEKANSSNLPDFWRVDLSANYDFALNNNWDVSLGASVWNLFDNKNIINAYYRKKNGEIELVEQKALGLTPNFLFRLIF